LTDDGHAPYLGMRATTADRERTIGVLRAGFAEGRLSKEEYAERADAAHMALADRELADLTRDLPAGPLPGISPPPRTNKTAISALRWGTLGLFVVPFGPVLAVILGHVAYGDIQRTGQRGQGLAVAAMAIGYCAITAMALLSVLIATVWT
jgi:hypothetical protein